MAYTIQIADSPFSFIAKEGETIAQAAERNNIQLRMGCRVGACGTCKGKVISGLVDNGPRAFALTKEDLANNMAVFCSAVPKSDLVLQNTGASQRVIASTKFKAQISYFERLTDDTIELVLARADGGKFNFLAGQTIDIFMEDGNFRSYSFASSANQKDKIMLLIRHVKGGKFTDQLFGGKFQVGTVFDVKSPNGSFTFKTPKTRQAIFLVTGTGISPALSIVRTLKDNEDLQGRKITLFWGARYKNEFYQREELEALEKESADFKFVPVCSREEHWHGAKGYVQTAAAELYGDMREIDCYLCGSNNMVDHAVSFLAARCGLKEQNTYSDAFGGAILP